MTFQRLLLTSFVMLVSALSLLAQTAVKMEEKKLTLPTYQVAPPDKTPSFYKGRGYQGAQGHVYPLPLYDVLTDVRKDQDYKVVYLNNEYTELCVAPELGGRILSAVDKTDNYDFFYHQHVIKPALIGMIGAWLSGGVEWNIPDHHRASSNLPVDYTMQENPDGSKTVWVGETELSRRLHWIVGLTLYPGKSYVEATVKVFNPTPFIHSFLYWANVSVHANNNYQVIFPPSTQFGAQHAKNEFTTWPIGSGNYAAMDRTGVDLSWWKNHPRPASIFAWNFKDDFIAGYDWGKDAGTVHVANHSVVTGKKFFLWGNNKEAQMWEKMLTEKDGQYLELMVGAYSDNQPDYSWIAPGETRVFKQIWYPIKKIGGVKNANNDAAVNLERKAPGTIKVGFNATAMFKQAKVVVSLSGKVYKEETIDIDPSKPYLKEFTINPTVKDTEVKVALLSKDGQELVSYAPVALVKEEMPKPVERPKAPKEYNTNEELYLTGLRLEEFRNATIDPLPYYEEALKRDSLDYHVNIVMGIRNSKEGKFSEAEKSFRRALKRLAKDYTHPKDGEAYYYLGTTLQFQNRLKEAKEELWKATWFSGFQSPAYYRLAQLACLDKNYAEALKMADQSLIANGQNTSSLALKAYILRRSGMSKQAKEVVATAQGIDKLDNWSAAEGFFAESEAQGNWPWSSENVSLLKYRFGGNAQSVLELVQNYGHIGAYEDALHILEMYQKSGEKQADFPMLYYYAGFYQMKNGKSADAKKSLEQGLKASSDYCFPFRLEELEILESAIKENPSDAKACYYLGNLHYFLNQKDKAIADWEKSVKLDDKFYLAYRNLGFAYDLVQSDVKKAIWAYEKAIALNTQDPRLYAEIDVLKSRAGVSPTERLAFLNKNIPTLEKRDDALTRLIELYNFTGSYDKALDIMTKRHFHVWEGGGNIHDVFVDANLLRGIKELGDKQYSKALKDFQCADTWPDNLEVGEPEDGGRRAQISYYTGLAYEGLKNSQASKEAFGKAMQLGGGRRINQGELGFYKAMALKKLGKADEAKSILEKIEKDANNQLKSSEGLDYFAKFGAASTRESRMADSYYLLGLASYGMGDKEKAKGYFTKVMELNQNHVWAKVMLDSKVFKD